MLPERAAVTLAGIVTRKTEIVAIAEQPLTEIYFLNAAPRGGMSVERLPVVRGDIVISGGCADDLDAIVACSDLQGVVRGGDDASVLLGVALAGALEELAYEGVVPPAARTGVILAGDLYSVPEANKRGGHGDVAEVWRAFAERFAWVAGVAGNHDDVASVPAIGDRIHLLDGEVVELDGLRIGGVGGIIGDPEKRGRRVDSEFLGAVDRAVDGGLDVLVLHEGRHGDAGQRGNSAIRETVEAASVGLTICGHVHWDSPLAVHGDGGQILNVDARAVVLVVRR